MKNFNKCLEVAKDKKILLIGSYTEEQLNVLYSVVNRIYNHEHRKKGIGVELSTEKDVYLYIHSLDSFVSDKRDYDFFFDLVVANIPTDNELIKDQIMSIFDKFTCEVFFTA